MRRPIDKELEDLFVDELTEYEIGILVGEILADNREVIKRLAKSDEEDFNDE